MNALAQKASGYNVTKKYFNMRKPMRATAELLDEPVRPDALTGLTAQTGLTSCSAENNKSAVIFDSKGKAEVVDWRVPIVTYLKDPGKVQRGIFGVWHLNTF